MKNNKKTNKKSLKKAPEKKNLSIVNQGDVVTIRNRSTTAASVLGAPCGGSRSALSIHAR